MKKIILVSLMAFACTVCSAQSVTLTFTGRDANNRRCQLDSISISNLSRGWLESITWPDTTFTMQNGVGIEDADSDFAFGLSQNTPNPFNGSTEVVLTTLESGIVAMEISDINGRWVAQQNTTRLLYGKHQFKIHVADAGIYFLTARQNGKTSSVKIINNGGTANGIEYIGTTEMPLSASRQPKIGIRGSSDNPFCLGDNMEYVGYATINDETAVSQHITQAQSNSENILLYFDATQLPTVGQPCPDMPTLTDVDGNTYNTVWIGTQCWMKENLRTTKYADGTIIPRDSAGEYQHACWTYPDGDSTNASSYGILYNWWAAMRNAPSSISNPSGVQGVCPNGWHLPSLSEWIQLKHTVLLQSPDYSEDAAALISGNMGWINHDIPNAAGDLSADNRDLLGFSILPAGWGSTSSPCCFGSDAVLWSASCFEGDGYAYCLSLYYRRPVISIGDMSSSENGSVRCLRNENVAQQPLAIPCPETPTVTDIDGNTYNTVRIGNQCWMRENLKTTRYADGRSIPAGEIESSPFVGYYFSANNDSANDETYGLLYNWPAMMDTAASSNANPSGVQGICPTGWHVPSKAEWEELTDYVSDRSEYRCNGFPENAAKALSSSLGWMPSDVECSVGYAPSGNNGTGFSALPAGTYECGFGQNAVFGVATDVALETASCIAWEYNCSTVNYGHIEKDTPASVRCLRD